MVVTRVQNVTASASVNMSRQRRVVQRTKDVVRRSNCHAICQPASPHTNRSTRTHCCVEQCQGEVEIVYLRHCTHRPSGVSYRARRPERHTHRG